MSQHQNEDQPETGGRLVLTETERAVLLEARTDIVVRKYTRRRKGRARQFMHPARVKAGATSGYDCATEILMKRDIVGFLKRFSRPWIIKYAGVFAALFQ